ncbi:MCE-family protein Mce1B [Actinokineospora spheciospongiae]|uniref:MCE-family protein Mce1B n=1 Tax=Actinokineospora spheciospongiae TaxID=909613 RepID=W7IXM9_9PSEU|nr:MlaD family protein [Actinokineospora spheciospongiae]EWC61597.1 MCE-family protein Mce1B [Actinokineospora spheciospongiae]PWW54922.1 phospholipid/cholesterol/gamma-HCH transport system substrate-binding protein [Actinokineospora spheciospongiae]
MKSVTGPLVKGLIFTVVTLVATIVLGVTIANKGSGDTISYSAKFTDVTSLNTGDDIRMSGVRVGQVEDIEVVDRKFSQVEFSVDRRWALSPTAIATVKFRNLIGQRYISIDQGTGSGTLPEDSVIPLDRTRPALDLTAMFNGFKPLFQALSPEDVNKLSLEVVQVLQGEGGTVDNLLTHVASLTTTLAQKDDVIGRVITNLNTVLGQVNSQGDQLSSLLLTTQQLVSGLAKDAKPIGDAISSIAELTTSTSDLLAQGREPLKRDIDALGQLSNTLANNTPQFESFLKNLPIKYEAIGRMASYGSWLNFYLCSATTDVDPAPGQGPGDIGLPNTAARCRS